MKSTVTASLGGKTQIKLKEMEMMLATNVSKGKCIMLVEGPDDKKFYARFVCEVHALIIVLGGGGNMHTILKYVKGVSILKDKVIGIKDSDFDKITGTTYDNDNLFFTDTHDLETMVITPELEDNVAIEALGHKERGMFRQVMSDLMPYSYIKLYNQMRICAKGFPGIRFDGFTLSKIYDGVTACRIEVCLAELKKHGNNGTLVHYPTESDIQQLIHDIPAPNIQYLTCGHDVINGVICRLISLKGSPSIGCKEIERLFRTSFTRERFKGTSLYQQVKKWASDRKTIVWAA